MSAHDEAGSVARAYFDALQAGDLHRGAALVADRCEWLHVATGEVFAGPEGYRSSASRWVSAFPDLSLDLRAVRSGPGWAVAELTASGTHTGVLETWAGRIPATGRPCALDLCYVLEVEGGKIVAGRIYYDSISMLTGLGLVSSRALALATRLLALRIRLLGALRRPLRAAGAPLRGNR